MSEAAPAAPPVEPTPTPAAAPQSTPTPTPAPGFLGGTPAAPAAPAEPVSGFFNESVAKDGQFQEGWTQRLQEAGFERLANKAALAKDEATLFKTLDETLGFVGKKQVLGYPKAGASDEDISNFRKEAGVPDSADAYQLKPDALPEGVEWNDEDAKQYAEIFHKHHVPEAAAKELIARHLESVGQQSSGMQEAFSAKLNAFHAESEQTFQKEWGENYDARLEANRAFVTTRFTPEELADPVMQAALSHPKIVRLIDDGRRNLREAPLPGVGSELAGNTMNPRQQAFEIMRANPGWRKDPSLSQRVADLHALQAAQERRK